MEEAAEEIAALGLVERDRRVAVAVLETVRAEDWQSAPLNLWRLPRSVLADFRSAVRDQLLSRSVQRASAVRRWTGWAIRPAAAWALSLFVAVALTTGALLWNTERTPAPGGILETPAPPVEPGDLETVKTVWSQTALFDELIQLGDADEEQLRQMLESAQKRAPYRQ